MGSPCVILENGFGNKIRPGRLFPRFFPGVLADWWGKTSFGMEFQEVEQGGFCETKSDAAFRSGHHKRGLAFGARKLRAANTNGGEPTRLESTDHAGGCQRFDRTVF
jgi:hypothetical protein